MAVNELNMGKNADETDEKPTLKLQNNVTAQVANPSANETTTLIQISSNKTDKNREIRRTICMPAHTPKRSHGSKGGNQALSGDLRGAVPSKRLYARHSLNNTSLAANITAHPVYKVALIMYNALWTSVPPYLDELCCGAKSNDAVATVH